MAKVTIGLLVYNGDKYLDRALSSLCAQTYQDLEIFISDNASTDETPKIIKKWEKIDPRINVVRQKKTMPFRQHYFWVIRNVKSKWFCYAAHDDLWSPNYIEELVTALEKSNSAIISVSNGVLMDVNENETKKHFYIADTRSKSFRGKIKHNFKIVKSSWFYAVYDRNALIELQDSIVCFNYVWGGDYALFLSFLFSDSIVGSDKATFYQRVTDLSEQKYRPKTARDKYMHYRDIWKEMLFYLNKSELSSIEKVSLIWVLIRYVSRVERMRRIVRFFLKELFIKN